MQYFHSTMWEIYTDGSCLTNPGPGGRAFVARLIQEGVCVQEKIGQGSDPNTTNNCMELTPCMQALQLVWEYETMQQWECTAGDLQEGLFATGPKSVPIVHTRVVLITDSAYVKLGITQWIQTWKRRQRRHTKGGKLVANIGLRKQIELLQTQFPNLTRQWTKAHVGNVCNEQVDALAKQSCYNRL